MTPSPAKSTGASAGLKKNVPFLLEVYEHTNHGKGQSFVKRRVANIPDCGVPSRTRPEETFGEDTNVDIEQQPWMVSLGTYGGEYFE